jgi:hypothetical protein
MGKKKQVKVSKTCFLFFTPNIVIKQGFPQGRYASDKRYHISNADIISIKASFAIIISVRICVTQVSQLSIWDGIQESRINHINTAHVLLQVILVPVD